MALLGESNQGLLAPRMGKAKGSYRFWEDALKPYLQRVASGEIAEQGLKRYGDAVRAGLQGDYSNFGEVAGDAIMGPFGGLLGTFGGKLAKTADLDMLKIAQEASERGMPESRVFDATGWFKGADGQWRFEIDDSASELVQSGLNRFHRNDGLVRQSQMFEHKGLFDAYPDARFYRMEKQAAPGGAYNDSTIWLAQDAGHPNMSPELREKSVRSVVLHENQHGIQDMEGFARGGNPDDMSKVLDEINFQEYLAKDDDLTSEFEELKRIWSGKEVPEKVEERVWELRKEIEANRARGWKQANDPFSRPNWSKAELNEAYKRLAGETEARNVQSRMGLLGDDRRMLPPWMTEDVPRDKQIVRFETGSQSSMGPKDYGIDHRPMTIEGGAATLDDLLPAFGEDIYGKNALQYFGSGMPEEKNILKIMRSVRGNPNAKVKIYRGVPEGAQQKINKGDWVTLDKNMAAEYGPQVIEMEVPAKHITSWADSLMEFGYYPD